MKVCNLVFFVFFFSAVDCAADKVITSDIVPIAVGCALAALVVVVLVAYLIGRRRARQRGYQSV
jgi:lysosomal-associated membrane protein 1/2